jgi:hypothetical protein
MAGFSPRLMSPRVMSPRVMSPRVMSPRVMSPRVMSPRVMSPRVMNPRVMAEFTSVSWPGLARPPTTFCADPSTVVGWPGHDGNEESASMQTVTIQTCLSFNHITQFTGFV